MALTNGPNLGLLFNGAQGELHYNELMARWRGLDALVQPRVIDRDLLTPPGSPADGDVHICARGELQEGLAWTRSGADIDVTWTAHGLTTTRPFRVTANSDVAAFALGNYTVSTVVDADTIRFTGISAGATSGTCSLFLLPYGAWAGKVDNIARYRSVSPGWEFYIPKAGWNTWVTAENQPVVYLGSGDAQGWNSEHGDLVTNTRGVALVDVTGLSAYTLTRTEAASSVILYLGDRDCTVTYASSTDEVVPAACFHNTQFIGYSIRVEQETSGLHKDILPGLSLYLTLAGGTTLGDLLNGVMLLARGTANAVTNVVADMTVGASNWGHLMSVDSASPVTLTIDGSTSPEYYSGQIFRVQRLGAGTVTIAGINGVTIKGVTSLGANQMVTALREADTGTWHIG